MIADASGARTELLNLKKQVTDTSQVFGSALAPAVQGGEEKLMAKLKERTGKARETMIFFTQSLG
ncbi:MAG: hypothetical protein IPL34_20515 [Thiofilum sp.]|uniref:hypothetical protein n=1 Tax=Thiofilum sp. TaxID=2212733 RepID=UPI0025F1B4F6|nr:hypothetical protein [Thiofilum sp.]MBK8455667.1 hypothetical protein [Thiofilum sp.]